MLGLILAVESWVASHPLEFTGNPVLLNWRTTGRAARGEEVRRSEVLCFGDSLVKHGSTRSSSKPRSAGRPSTWRSRRPGPASYFLLRRTLDAGARPRALIVDFHPGLLLSRPSHAVISGRAGDRPGTVELSCVARDFRLFHRHGPGQGPAHGEGPPRLPAPGAGGAAGRGVAGGRAYPALLRNWRVNRGATGPARGRRGPSRPARDPDADAEGRAGRANGVVGNRPGHHGLRPEVPGSGRRRGGSRSSGSCRRPARPTRPIPCGTAGTPDMSPSSGRCRPDTRTWS